MQRLHYYRYTCKFCKARHSSLLHVDQPNNNVGSNVSGVESSTNHIVMSSVKYDEGILGNDIVCNASAQSNYIYMPIVNVAINNSLHTFALLDTASSNTFISERAFNLLGLNGDCITYNLSTLGNYTTVNSKIVNFTLYSISGEKSLHMSSVFVVINIPYAHHKLDVNQYDHLKNIPFAKITSSHVDLLIGQDNAEASLPNDVFRGRWGFVQYLAGIFWRRWTREYLTELQKRSKWLIRRKNLSIVELVMLLDENTPRSLWPLGLVIVVSIGRDGLVRSVRLKTRSNELVRPITKVVFLEAFGHDAVPPRD